MKKDIWFQRKQYGWGWGLPNVWQGWVVYGVYVASLFVFSAYVDPKAHILGWLLGVVILSVILIAVCYLKGETPKWSWGKK
ncbi:TPA: hypothetical protein NJ077_004673 [Vibrio parahaemolyticus]|uniref:hypothetical protein n=1 Tax=Vibrio parahaemolyticus TaxID=670 RepID=UPI00111FC3A1|nr:hypothetical protein [Vibrio parahaemolyticus]TOC20507.1 hypothetical protein CGJ89_23800 [Vibrio parahaemolyticus]HCG6123154.1 hypothetical protein [Vibrio parahaemolyticus]HCG6989577.1 hypothetical protein [Vibrio parahaemolyticus]